MLARRLIRPVGQVLAPCCTRGATSAAVAPSDNAAAIAKRNQEILKRMGMHETKPGIFGGILSDFVGERLGVTGVYTLGGGLFLYGISKQIFLYNEESTLFVPTVIGLHFLFGKGGIDAAHSVEEEVSVRKDVFDVLRANASMYRETLFRERQAAIHDEVLKRLMHQADLEATRRRVQQTHMITWIEREVVKDVATQLDEQAVMRSCLAELQSAVNDAKAPRATA